MSLRSEEEQSDSAMGEDGMNRRESIGKRSWSSSLPRTRKGSSRIATVKPVSKWLSSSEEELSKTVSSKTSPRKDLGSTSPRFARLLSKDVASMEKDAIVAELEKCLNELENDETSYSSLVDEYKRMEEERDELAIELENTFEDLETYMHHVKDVEADKQSIVQERDELLKEVESLKFCLTSRQQIQESGLKKEKLELESQLKDVNEENANMKEQISELLEERQSLISSLLNLHSAEVDDVIQTRSRSCSTVSMESAASSSLLRSECVELKERAKEAEEAEVKITEELIECRNLLKAAIEDKTKLEDETEELHKNIGEYEVENSNLLKQINEFTDEAKRVEEITELRKDNESLRLAVDALKNGNKTFKYQNERGTIEKLEKKVVTLENELCLAQEECGKLAERVTESNKKTQESRAKSRKEKQALEEEIKRLENELKQRKTNQEKLVAAENDARNKELIVTSLRREKEKIEKQMAEIGQKLLNERANNKQERVRLEEEVEKVKNILDANKFELQRLSNLENCVKKKDSEITDLRRERKELQEDIDYLNEQMKQNEADFTSKNKNLEKRIVDLDTQRGISDKMKEKVSKLSNEIKELKVSNDLLVKEKDNRENDFSTMETNFKNKIEKHISERKDAEEFIQHLELQIEKLKLSQEELMKTKGEFEMLKKSFVSLEKDRTKAESFIEEERSKHLREKNDLEMKLNEKSKQIDEVKNKLNETLAREQKLRETGFKQRKLEQTLSDALQDKSELEKDKLRLSAEIEDLNIRINVEDSKKQGMNKFESEIRNLHSRIENLEDRNEKLEIENREISQQCRDFEGLLTSIRQEKSHLESEINNISSENSLLLSDLQESSEKLKSSNNQLQNMIMEKKAIENEMLLLRSSSKEIIQGHRESTSTTSHIQKDEEYIEDKSDYVEIIRNLQEELARFKSENSALELECRKLKDRQIKSREIEAQMSNTIEKLRPEISARDLEIVALKKRLDGIDAENVELRNMQRAYEGYKVSITKNVDEKTVTLTRQINSLQDKLTKAHQDNKSLLERIRNMEENNTTALRSFKVRKNELQMQLTNSLHEKEDLEKEINFLRGQVANEQELSAANQELKKEVHFYREKLANEEGRFSQKDSQIKDLQEQLKEAEEQARHAHCTAAEVDLQYRECTRKLHESEILILDLQKAVARANDVAMEKTLESSRNKRLLEKKLEKILKENSDLRNQLVSDGPKMVEREQNTRHRSRSDILQSQEINGVNERRSAFHSIGLLRDQNLQSGRSFENESIGKYQRKQSIDVIQASLAEKGRDVTLSRSGSAPLSKRLSTTNSNNQLVKATVMARSVSPPVRYFSDTESLGSKPDSNDDDPNQPVSSLPKPPPPSYYVVKRTSLGGEMDRRSIQPDRVHRPIKLKEIPIPNLSPASERRSPRSPVSAANNKKVLGKERMEHWV